VSFKDNLDRDIGTFLAVEDFGTEALYDGHTVPVQFFEKSERLWETRASSYDSPSGGVESATPFILARRSDLPGISHGSTIRIGDVDYSVVDIEYRRSDIVKLILSEKHDRPFNV